MTGLKTSILAVSALAALVATTTIAIGEDDAPPAVKARKAQMQIIAYHTGLLGAIAKGEAPHDQAIVDVAARNVARMAMIERTTLWLEGTEQGAVKGSRAKAEIWSDPDGFAAKFDALEKAATGLVGAADAAAVGAGMGALGGACKGCHEGYRGPKN